MDKLANYYCVFFAGDDIRHTKPVALFDRTQFIADFIFGCHGRASFREEDDRLIVFTVAEWLEMYDPESEVK